MSLLDSPSLTFDETSFLIALEIEVSESTVPIELQLESNYFINML